MTVFPYIADASLVLAPSQACSVCGSEGKVYQARDLVDAHISGACAACIQGGRVLQVDAWSRIVDVYQSWLSEHHPDTPAGELKGRLDDLVGRLQHTPCGPMQSDRGVDWPICCDDITQFTGFPDGEKALYDLVARATYWEFGLGMDGPYFRRIGLPEDLHQVKAFRCPKCQRDYWTFQFF
ncbi:MAG: hypothetical protein ACYCW6_20510 [Candidatus Xenobia bacterium]